MSRDPSRRPPPPLSPVSLRAKAEEHLRRFSPSVTQMRRVLLRRVDRCLEAFGGDRVEGAAMVEQVLLDLLACGLLDDRRLTHAWVESLHRRGVPARAMRGRLQARGLDGVFLNESLERLGRDAAEPELMRACTYALRRRIGAARADHRRPTEVQSARRQREKDIACLCRAGFSLGIALRVVDCDDLQALALEAGDGGT